MTTDAKRLADELDQFAKAIDEGQPGEPECRVCGEFYLMPGGYDPTALCNSCAQKAAAFLPDIIRELRRVERMERAMKLAEVQYMGAGGNMKDAEVVDAMRAILLAALAGQEVANEA